ncbi:bleomycin hydrolase [Weissella beninensis]|uniref:Aminopeptidase n=1 Tax=Periweissella beninensis TaxID=504936 RepID=A0ABT0VJ03_9LACO|nr:C1 family peptidase [Periweissella beninensis]MBM7544417.1 bleomycin hydrolase [Periweissella beninensis]MCM2437817.1 C1 family peptidase [Periweissella beninensis]
MSKEISLEQIANFKNNVESQPGNAIIRRAVVNNGIYGTALDKKASVDNTPVFSIDLDTGKVANQKQSGRCWMFAALNTMRHDIKDMFKLSEEFQLSQSYTFFWDKFEKANYFYENIIKTADEALDSRKVAFLLATPQQDGGQWDMMVAIIEKYGVVPQAVYPESQASSASHELNVTLNLKLRHDAVILRDLIAAGSTIDQIAVKKNEMLQEIYRFLSLTLGEPPVKFDFEYRDQNQVYHHERDITPQEYYQKFVGWDLNEYVSIINAPTTDKPYNHTYGVEMLGNVVGGRAVRHLNVEMDEFKKLAIKQLSAGQSVWFGVDMGPQIDRNQGLMVRGVHREDELFNIDLAMSKAQRLDYGQSLMTHAMVLTGVDIVDGQPTKWKVENSWGEKVGKKGYFTMSDAWMDEFCYQIVVKKEFLPDNLKAVYETETATLLKPWDPMGALA